MRVLMYRDFPFEKWKGKPFLFLWKYSEVGLGDSVNMWDTTSNLETFQESLASNIQPPSSGFLYPLNQSLWAASRGDELICMSSPPSWSALKILAALHWIQKGAFKKVINKGYKENIATELSPMHLKCIALLSFKLLQI